MKIEDDLVFKYFRDGSLTMGAIEALKSILFASKGKKVGILSKEEVLEILHVDRYLDVMLEQLNIYETEPWRNIDNGE